MTTYTALAATVAAQLDKDCPRPYLEERQRKFMAEVLGRAQDHALAEVARCYQKKISFQKAEKNLGDIERALEELPTASFVQMLVWIDMHTPPEMCVRQAFFALTHETRKAWAKEAAVRLMDEREEWHDIAPDIRDELAQDVAEAWHAGMKERNARNAWRAEMDKEVETMKQPSLFKMLCEEKDYWTIGRYASRLTGKYASKFKAMFTEEQWSDIQGKAACQYGPEDTAKFAECERPELYRA